MRPAGSASAIGASANKAISTPTAHSLWPCLSACSGAAMRTPAMQEWRLICPRIKASSGRENLVTSSPSTSSSCLLVVGVFVLQARDQGLHPCVRHRFNRLEAARHRARAALRRVDRVAGLVELLLGLREHV